MFDFFKSRKEIREDFSGKKSKAGMIIAAIVLCAGVFLGMLVTEKDIPLPVSDVFRLKFSIIDAAMLAGAGVVYLIIIINRRRNNGK